MLFGFEVETAELNAYEKDTLLPMILAGLGIKKGVEMAVTNKQICERMTSRGYPISGARVRKIIHYIRVKRLLPFLCASSKGYWIEPDLERYMQWIGSMVGRNQAIALVIKSSIQDLPEQYQHTWD